MFVTQVQRAQCFRVVLAVEHGGLVARQLLDTGGGEGGLLDLGAQRGGECGRAAEAGEVLRFGEADLQRQLAPALAGRKGRGA